MLKLLIVDGNGTILDDWPAGYAGTCAVLDHYGLARVSLAEYAREVGRDGNWHDFYVRRGISATGDELYALYAPAYHAHEEEICLMDGTLTALASIRDAGIHIHLLTAAREDFIMPVLRQTGVFEFLDQCHFGIKDKAACIRDILQATGYDRAECGMVGDLPSDVRYAQEAGIVGIALHNLHLPDDIFATVKPDFYALTFADMARYVIS